MSDTFHGSFVLVLHAHLPFVLRQDRMEEEMILDATAETYLPILSMCEQLVDEGISPKITIDFSPVLLEQLANPYFHDRFREFCELQMENAREDQEHFAADPHLRYLAKRWEEFYSHTYQRFADQYGCDLIGAFRRLQDGGHIELMTCGATHAYFPALYRDASIRAQVKMAAKCHQKHFGRHPRGIWLPECGYRPPCQWSPSLTSRYGEPTRHRPGVEEFLSESDIEYFIADFHQLANAHPADVPRTPFDTYYVSGVHVPKKPVTVLSRDIELSLQVWTRDVGYPGDGAYMDFHKRHGRGKLRYWKVTHPKLDMQYKDAYYPDDSFEKKVQDHAGHFKLLVAQTLKQNHEQTGRAKLALTAFDAELFGHWWFEGPSWLYYVIKWIHEDPEIDMATCSEYLDREPAYSYLSLPESSWGSDYNSSTWINKGVEWTWERIYHAENEMEHLAQELGERDDPTLQRILRQVMRELFVLQASDWQFMITNWSTRNLGEKRVTERHEDFKRLAKLAWDYGQGRQVDEPEWVFLHDCETRNDLFDDPEIWWFAQ